MLKNHKQDRFDGGRAASIVNGPEPAADRSLKLLIEQGTQSLDEEARALALAILALAPDND